MPEVAADETPSATQGMAYARPDDLATVRAFVRRRASALGLDPAKVDMLTIAVSELVTNTLQHTTGGGRVRVWGEPDCVVCDVEDAGVARPFRGMPPPESVRGRGLAIVNIVADAVRTFVTPAGTTVEVRMTL
jgi:serine/threonine-protein kinase RsbW